MTGNTSGKDNGPPFERHRTYYIVLKIAVLAAALLLALKLVGVW